MTQKLYGENSFGEQSLPINLDPRHSSEVFVMDNSNGFVQGDAAANGTLILSLEVPAGEIFYLKHIMVSNKGTIPLTIRIVQNTIATVGGAPTELFHLVVQSDNMLTISQDDGFPIVIIDNRSGVASLYCNVILPQNAGDGVLNNNAATEFVSATINGILE